MSKSKSYRNPDSLPFHRYPCRLVRITPLDTKPAPEQVAKPEYVEPRWVFSISNTPCADCEQDTKV